MSGKISSIALRVCAGTTALTALLLSTTGAQAQLAISSQPTNNVTCSEGVCTATAKQAVLNVTDLGNMLASSSVKVATGTVTTGIHLGAPLSWVSANTLTLDAYKSITINKKVSVTGTGVLTILTNDGGKGGMLSFGDKGSVTFWSLSSSLVIDGKTYTLAGDIAALASDIAGNLYGNFALANNYNARKDGTYSAAPIATTFSGTFEGLGHTISNLRIDARAGGNVGLFAFVSEGSLHDIDIVNAHVVARGHGHASVGVLAGSVIGGDDYGYFFHNGSVTGSHSTGSVSSESSNGGSIGGLIGYVCNYGGLYPNERIANSHSTASVSGGANVFAGGLLGWDCGTIEDSYATGSVTAKMGSYVGGLAGFSSALVSGSFATGNVSTGDADGGGPPASAGGLVGYNFWGGGFGLDDSGPGIIRRSYALGSVVGGMNTNVGGLAGYNYRGAIERSYSAGSVFAGTGSYVGGLVGIATTISHSYWDTTTSGITNLSQGCGNVSNCSGATGLTNAQLQSGLPHGFHPRFWVENASINGGLPYLLNNPPPT